MRSILIIAALTCAAWLTACASGEPKPKPKEPVRLELGVNALSDVNRDERGRAAPIVVRIYELKNDAAFESADFFTLQNREKVVLADDVIRRDEYQLRPGERRMLTRPVDPATRAIGVVAAYRDLPKSDWRAVYAMSAASDEAWYRTSRPKLKLTIDLEANAIRINETKK